MKAASILAPRIASPYHRPASTAGGFLETLIDRLRTVFAGRYLIEREVGRGGMATVYVAQDLKHGRRVAIKVLKPELAAALGPERFLREIEIAAGLTHPLIVPLHDSGETSGFLYYVMPYIEGESLRSRLAREKQLAIEEALEIARDVADALSYAHSQGVVHRDVKPENILFQVGHAVVSDFGIARAIVAAGGEKLTETGIALGTPAYMSPEQAAGSGQLDGRSDVYSLACVVYEMLAGEPPFTGPTAESIVHQHLVAEPPLVTGIRAGVPDAIVAALGRALAKTPADRYRSVAQFAEAFRSPPPPVTAPTTPRVPRIGGLVAVSIAAAVLLAYAEWTSRWSTAPSAVRRAAPTSVAVLYFDNLSRDSADTYLADGLSEEIMVRLGQVRRLSVKSRFESQRLRGRASSDLGTVVSELNAAYVVTGSIQKTGTRVRVRAELIRAATGDQVWGDVLDRKSADLLEIEEEIARSVVRGIVGQLLPEERTTLARRATRDPQAYDLYLRGRFFFDRDTESDLRRAIDLYQQAIARDSGYALAYAGLALAWGALGDDYLPPRDVASLALAAARHALALDSTLALAYVVLAGDAFQFDRNFARAKLLLRRAIELDANLSDAHAALSAQYVIEGSVDSAVAESDTAWMLDSLDAGVGYVRFDSRMAGRHYIEALDIARALTARDTLDPRWWGLQGRALLALGRCTDALAAAHRGGVLGPNTAAVVRALVCLGRHADARQAFGELRRLALTRYVPKDQLAAEALALGEREEALRLLEQADADRSFFVLWLSWNPDFDALRDDPRFVALERRIGLRLGAP